MIKKKISIIVILLALIFCALAFLSIEKARSYLPNNEAVFHDYYSDFTLENGELTVEKDGTVSITYKNGLVIKTESLPLYMNDNQSIILTDTFMYFMPLGDNTFKKYKVEPLTEITVNGEVIQFKKNNEQIKMYGGFLYNGDNVYIPLEDISLSFLEQEIGLKMFSYVVVDPSYFVQYYDTGEAECSYFECDERVRAQFEYYQVDLTLDTYKFGDNESFMIANFEQLPIIFRDGN